MTDTKEVATAVTILSDDGVATPSTKKSTAKKSTAKNRTGVPRKGTYGAAIKVVRVTVRMYQDQDELLRELAETNLRSINAQLVVMVRDYLARVDAGAPGMPMAIDRSFDDNLEGRDQMIHRQMAFQYRDEPRVIKRLQRLAKANKVGISPLVSAILDEFFYRIEVSTDQPNESTA